MNNASGVRVLMSDTSGGGMSASISSNASCPVKFGSNDGVWVMRTGIRTERKMLVCLIDRSHGDRSLRPHGRGLRF